MLLSNKPEYTTQDEKTRTKYILPNNGGVTDSFAVFRDANLRDDNEHHFTVRVKVVLN